MSIRKPTIIPVWVSKPSSAESVSCACVARSLGRLQRVSRLLRTDLRLSPWLVDVFIRSSQASQWQNTMRTCTSRDTKIVTWIFIENGLAIKLIVISRILYAEPSWYMTCVQLPTTYVLIRCYVAANGWATAEATCRSSPNCSILLTTTFSSASKLTLRKLNHVLLPYLPRHIQSLHTSSAPALITSLL